MALYGPLLDIYGHYTTLSQTVISVKFFSNHQMAEFYTYT